MTPDNQTVVENVWPGDCRELSLAYVLDKARMMGAAAFAMSAFTVKLWRNLNQSTCNSE